MENLNQELLASIEEVIDNAYPEDDYRQGRLDAFKEDCRDDSAQ